MPIYAVTFRIADELSIHGTYGERWASVNDTIRSKAIGRNYWKETTSFFALEAAETSAASLANAINAGSKFDSSRDLLMVINLSAKAHAVIGVNNDKDLETIMALR